MDCWERVNAGADVTSRGRFLEDFYVGQHIRHPLGRTITATDNTWFAAVTMNTNQLHFNSVYASRSEFGQPLVVSTLTVALAVGLSVSDLSQNAVANLAWDDIRLPAPVFVGDTVWSESIVIDVRRSTSRSDAGIVKVRTRALNQDGVEVCSFQRTFIVYDRSAAARVDVFPVAATPLRDLP